MKYYCMGAHGVSVDHPNSPHSGIGFSLHLQCSCNALPSIFGFNPQLEELAKIAIRWKQCCINVMKAAPLREALRQAISVATKDHAKKCAFSSVFANPCTLIIIEDES